MDEKLFDNYLNEAQAVRLAKAQKLFDGLIDIFHQVGFNDEVIRLVICSMFFASFSVDGKINKLENEFFNLITRADLTLEQINEFAFYRDDLEKDLLDFYNDSPDNVKELIKELVVFILLSDNEYNDKEVELYEKLN